ncbi:response regulator [Methylorubrum populi]|jgi:CheY-like chemotaxis protein|uniref:Response regulator n=1 Tax=Methylorubrum rhodesianum TaxID=29427 RepID=A0ABU9Z7U3_9HYPH|nr:response regulator [Methylorubrum rhodesianum]MBK3401200.1 response regulator [Methylorubrum rhodesianum]MBY0140096.1 response regulator [Methylorubrum populi]HEV2544144.1 response regulator [Methylobacterium sp.]
MSPHPAAFSPVVLVVEDETLLRILAVDFLEDEGFTVLEAGTAEEAWLILESRADIGVLFTDVNMPGEMDGLALAARVAERWPHIRLVVTSRRQGLTSDQLPDDGQFVQKPYRQTQIVTAIAHAA